MPNWCGNRLIITGAEKELRRFVKKNKADDCPLSFQKSVPMPKKLECTDGMKSDLIEVLTGREEPVDWYTWRVKYWGTKWDLTNDTHVVGDGENLEYQFDTAWGPPLEWMKAVSRLYPELTFKLKYEEGGMNFSGLLRMRNGRILERTQRPAGDILLYPRR